MPRQLPVGLLMFIAARDMENRVIAAMRRAGVDDVTLAQGRVAARIGPDGTRLRDLADQAQVSKQTATALVDRLEQAGYVEQIPDPSDGQPASCASRPRASPCCRSRALRSSGSSASGSGTSAPRECASCASPSHCCARSPSPLPREGRLSQAATSEVAACLRLNHKSQSATSHRPTSVGRPQIVTAREVVRQEVGWVGDWRGDAVAFRFQPPPVEPCMRFSRTRLTDILHRRCSAGARQARLGRGATTMPLRETRPSSLGDR